MKPEGNTEDILVSDKWKKIYFYDKKEQIRKSQLDNEKAVMDFADGYKKFLDVSKTEREAVKETIKRAIENGFEEFDPDKKYKPFDKVYYNNRGKAVILAVIGEDGLKNGALISVAHIDSPRLDLKAHPAYESNSIAYFKTHYYGGIKKYQWPTIPLALHGVIVNKDGEKIEINIGESEGDVNFCISDLLPHLADEQMKKPLGKAICGEDLNAIVGSLPAIDEDCENLSKLRVLMHFLKEYKLTEEDFISAELSFVPAYHAVDIGFDRSMVGAYGQDDKVCAYAALKATLEAEKPKKTLVTVLTDKEEIGSDGNTGLNSNYLLYFIKDLAEAEGLKINRVLSKSTCLSADVNAAFDPNFASQFDVNNSSYLGKGTVVTKYTGHGGKYSTSDASAEFMAHIRKILDDDNVIWQTGELGKADSGGGGTVAKYIASLNVDVVDVGVPVLSMHAPFEIVSKFDLFMTYKAFSAFLKS